MISTANYEARKFGVRSAMPGFIAKRLCPHLVFVKPNFEKYTKIAAIAREVFAEVDPEFESRGLDEASLDATAFCQRMCQPASQVRLTASRGFFGPRVPSLM
jgi:DNA polymerase kappa